MAKLIDEMFETLWTSYPSDLCRKKRGGKQPAYKAFQKINPTEEEFHRIMANMRAQVKADRQDKDAYRWPFVSSYLNQGRYDDYIEIVEKTKKQELQLCSMDSCNSPVHGHSYSMCSFHIPSQHDARLRDAWTRTGISKRDPDYLQQCRDYCKERMSKLCQRS